MAASLFCAPVVYPPYLLWILPFLRSRSTLPIIVWTVSILPAYYVRHLRAMGVRGQSWGGFCDAGIWICGNGGCNYRVALDETT